MADKPNLLAENDFTPEQIAASGLFSRREKLDRLRDMKQALAERANEADLSLDRAEERMAEIEIAVARVKRQPSAGHEAATLGRMPSA
ncbi:MAG: hypothetical protein WAU86_08530 [Oricola sp.]